MTRLSPVLLIVFVSLVALMVVWRRFGSRHRAAHEVLITESGGPISQEALLTDVDQSITPERA